MFSAIGNAYDSLSSILSKTTNGVLATIFDATQSMFYNGVSYTIVGIIACVWLLQRLKDGFSKEVIFKAGTWVVIVAFVYAAFSSSAAYYELISWFAIPVSWLKNGVAAAAGGDFKSSMTTITGVMDARYEDMRNVIKIPQMWKEKDWIPAALEDSILGIRTLLNFWALYGILLILVVAVCFMQLVSIFMGGVVLSMSPLLLPCLIISPLKGFFFSWIKLFISIMMYQPFSLIVLGVARQGVNLITGVPAEALVEDPFDYCLPSMVIAVAAIYMCKQIPTWINQLMGTNVGGMGEGAGQSMFGAAREGLTKGGQAALFGSKDPETGKRSGGLLSKGAGAVMGAARGAKNFGSNAVNNRRGGDSIAKSLGKAMLQTRTAQRIKGAGQATAKGFRATSDFFRGRK